MKGKDSKVPGVSATNILDAGPEHPDWYNTVGITDVRTNEQGLQFFSGIMRTENFEEVWTSGPASESELKRFYKVQRGKEKKI